MEGPEGLAAGLISQVVPYLAAPLTPSTWPWPTSAAVVVTTRRWVATSPLGLNLLTLQSVHAGLGSSPSSTPSPDPPDTYEKDTPARPQRGANVRR